MEGAIGSGLFKTVGRGVHGLSSGSEGAGGQHFHLLGMSDFSAGVDDLLSGLLEFSGEGSKLKHFTFDEGVSRLLYGSVDDGLIGLSGLEDTLSKGVEGGMHTVAGSCSQLDREHRVSLSHGKVSTWTSVVEDKPYIFGPALVVVGVVDGRHNAESPVRPVFDKWGSQMHVSCRVIDHILVGTCYYDGGSR